MGDEYKDGDLAAYDTYNRNINPLLVFEDGDWRTLTIKDVVPPNVGPVTTISVPPAEPIGPVT